MGYHTEFEGSVEINPPLNPAEIDYLMRFNDSRRFHRVAGPYAIDDHGYNHPDTIDINTPPPGQPELWCPWLPTDDGTELVWDGTEKPYEAANWMTYLIETFLKPRAALQREMASPVPAPPGRYYDPAFEHFTFDHTVHGSILARGEDFDDIWTLVVKDNEVSTRKGHHHEPGPTVIKVTAERVDDREPAPVGRVLRGEIEG